MSIKPDTFHMTQEWRIPLVIALCHGWGRGGVDLVGYFGSDIGFVLKWTVIYVNKYARIGSF